MSFLVATRAYTCGSLSIYVEPIKTKWFVNTLCNFYAPSVNAPALYIDLSDEAAGSEGAAVDNHTDLVGVKAKLFVSASVYHVA